MFINLFIEYIDYLSLIWAPKHVQEQIFWLWKLTQPIWYPNQFPPQY